MGPSKAVSVDLKPGVTKKVPVKILVSKNGEDLDKNDAGVDYRATDISRQSNFVSNMSAKKPTKGFAGDEDEGDRT
jgi:hypothetical protein